jgi:thiamine kinase-like enzyme
MNDKIAVEMDEQVLKKYLEYKLSRRFARPTEIVGMQCEEFVRQTSFLAHIVTLRLDTGDVFKIFLKDYSKSRLLKDDLPLRRNREYQVYRDLLSHTDLEVPMYCGAVWRPEIERFWLLIEYVEGTELRYLGFEDWIRAAAWLGGFQGAFVDRKEDLEASRFLVHHDEDFFLSKAETAVTAVSEFSLKQAKRLARVLSGYDRIVNIMVSQPRTLVHGSFRPQNILLAHKGSSVRVYPVDWELAAYGAGLYDLSFIVDGFNPPKLDRMINAYCRQAEKRGINCLPRKQFVYMINCFRLHKIIKSMSDSVKFRFSSNTVNKLVGMAEVVGGRVF